MGRQPKYSPANKNPIDPATGKPKIGRPKKEKPFVAPRPKGRPRKCEDGYTNVNINLSNEILEEARGEAQRFFNKNLSSYIAHLVKNDTQREVKQVNVYKTGSELLREMFPEISDRKFRELLQIVGSDNRKEVLKMLRQTLQQVAEFKVSSGDCPQVYSKEFYVTLPADKYNILYHRMLDHNEDESEAIARIIGTPPKRYPGLMQPGDRPKKTSMYMPAAINNMLDKICVSRGLGTQAAINTLIEEEYNRKYKGE